MTDLPISRRNVLAGLGVVGAGAALGGAGTLALFTDEERFPENRLVAGELDLKMDWEVHYNGEVIDKVPLTVTSRADIAANFNYDLDDPEDAARVEELFRNQFRDVPDDIDAPVIALDDVKPGDWGEVTFSVHLFDNPGYLWWGGHLLENADNGVNEPEGKSEGEDGTDVGELLDEILVTMWYDDGDNVLEENETYPHGDGVVSLTRAEAVFFEGTLREAMQVLSVGVPLDADPSDESEGGRECYLNSTTYHVCLGWELPVDVGNHVQSDSTVFDLAFYTEQCRHNDGEVNPFISVESGDGWPSVAGSGWIGKVRYGGTNTYELEVGNGPGDRTEEHYEAFRTSGSHDFTLAYDPLSGLATLDVEGTTIQHGVVTADDGLLGIVAKAPAGGRTTVSDLRVNGQPVFASLDADATSGSAVTRHLQLSGGDFDLGFVVEGTVTVDLTGATSTANELPALQFEVERP